MNRNKNCRFYCATEPQWTGTFELAQLVSFLSEPEQIQRAERNTDFCNLFILQVELFCLIKILEPRPVQNSRVSPVLTPVSHFSLSERHQTGLTRQCVRASVLALVPTKVHKPCVSAGCTASVTSALFAKPERGGFELRPRKHIEGEIVQNIQASKCARNNFIQFPAKVTSDITW